MSYESGVQAPLRRISIQTEVPLPFVGAIYSLTGTAKLNDLDPKAYLRFVLAHISDQAINRVDELMQWVVAANCAARTKYLALDQ